MWELRSVDVLNQLYSVGEETLSYLRLHGLRKFFGLEPKLATFLGEVFIKTEDLPHYNSISVSLMTPTIILDGDGLLCDILALGDVGIDHTEDALRVTLLHLI